MRQRINAAFPLLFMMIPLLLGNSRVPVPKQVELATTERAPYIGEDLPNQGYVAELVTEAFRRAGYEARIEFYPLVRAQKNAADGTVDGLVPAYFEKSLAARFVFSDPFPGDHIGLLKKKNLSVDYPVASRTDLTAALRGLTKYTFGLVRGASVAPDFDQASFLTKELTTTDLENLDKLIAGKTDFAVIDKYTAADLMVTLRPHVIGKLDFLHPPLANRAFHVAFSKKSQGFQERCRAFNRGLKALADEGIMDRILARHGVFPPKVIAPGKTRLTIGTVNNADMMIMQRLSKDFERAHPHIALEWRILDENTLRQRLLSDLSISDGQFDIMTIGSYEAPLWAKRGWLTPLQVQDSRYEIEDVLKSVREALSVQGRLYALPFYAESSMMFYRKDLFRNAGLTMPDRPTYQDVLRFAAALHNPGQNVYGICLRGKPGWGENMALLTTMVNTFGGRWFDEQWHPTLKTPEWQAAVSTYRTLLTRFGPPHATANGFNENLSLFADGRCGMWIDATVAAGLLFNPKQSKVHDRLGFAPAPVAKTQKGAHWLWTWALAVPDSSTHKKKALAFITWATSKRYIQRVARQEGWVSVPPGTRESTYANPDYQAAAPFAAFVLKAIQTADPVDSTAKPKPYTGIQFVGIPEFPAIGHQVGQNIARVIEGKLPVDQALLKSQRVVELQMKMSGYY